MRKIAQKHGKNNPEQTGGRTEVALNTAGHNERWPARVPQLTIDVMSYAEWPCYLLNDVKDGSISV